ncbi:MAG: DUF937 domain-containing protein [Bacteroidia bacterium]
MDELLEQLKSKLDSGTISSIASKIGADEGQTSMAIQGALPTLLGAMSTNSQSKEGAQGLLSALDKDHDGSIFDDLGSHINNFQNGSGSGILKHVLGGNSATVEQALGAKSGLNSSQSGQLMQILAPIVMGFLGKQKRSSAGGFDISQIANLLGGMSKEADKSTSLDLSDVLSVVGGLTGGGKSGGIGGLLGKLFK